MYLTCHPLRPSTAADDILVLFHRLSSGSELSRASQRTVSRLPENVHHSREPGWPDGKLHRLRADVYDPPGACPADDAGGAAACCRAGAERRLLAWHSAGA